jgi:hypothetical protein
VLAGCGSGSDDDSWAAQVDGVAIPAADLRRLVDERMEDSPDARRQDVANDVLQVLLSDQVVLNVAAKRHIEVTPAQVEERLLQLHGPEWKDPDPRYRETVRREMVLERTALADLGARARVPDSALRAYFEEHKAEYGAPARVRSARSWSRRSPRPKRCEARSRAATSRAARANSIGPRRQRGHAAAIREGRCARGLRPRLRARARARFAGDRVALRVPPVPGDARLPAHEASFDEVREKIALELGERSWPTCAASGCEPAQERRSR